MTEEKYACPHVRYCAEKTRQYDTELCDRKLGNHENCFEFRRILEIRKLASNGQRKQVTLATLTSP